MENALNHTNLPTFQTKKTKTHHQHPLMGNALHESLQSSRGIRRKREEYLKQTQNKKFSEDEDEDEGDDEEEKVEVKKKIIALQKIVPGGETFGCVDELFEETAGYILALKCQIKAMRVVTSFIEGLEKQKTKYGG